MSERFVTADGVDLNLDQSGQGLPVVFQHGLCGDASQTAQVFPDGLNYRRLTLECRGHGASDAGQYGHFSIAQFTTDLADMISHKNLDRPVVGGISMGAAIALRLAVTRPELVRALVIARPAWVTEAAPDNMAPNALVGELLAEHAPDEALGLFEATDVAADLTRFAPDNLASLRGFFRRQPIALTSALLSRISADGPGVDLNDLASLRLPVLVIGHDRDSVHPISLAREMAAAIPTAKFVEITPKVTDLARYQADFRAALAEFLKGL